MPFFCKSNGFSLVEITFVLLLIAMLVVLGLPNLGDRLQGKEHKHVIRQLYTVINYARSEAVKHGRKIILCPSDNGSICGNDWSKGYIVFIGDDNKTAPRCEQLLRAYPAVPGKLIWHGLQKGKNYLVFDHDSFADTQQGTFKYCGKSQKADDQAITLIISPNGRARYADSHDPVYYCRDL